MDTRMARVMLVDDERNVLSALHRALRGEPYEVIECTSGAEALERLRRDDVEVIISDHMMPNMSGIDFLRNARIVRPGAVRIMLTGQADLEMAMRAVNEGSIYRFLMKPWDHFDLKTVLRLAVRHAQGRRQEQELAAEAVELRRAARP